VAVSQSKSSGVLWRHADFLRLWAAQTVSSFGARITREGLPYAAVLTINAKPLELGLLAALTLGPGLIVGLFSGGYIDRSRKRSILVWSDIFRAAILLTVPIAAWFQLLSMTQIYFVAALAGAASVLFDIADHAYLPRLIGRDDLMEGNSKLGVTESLAEIGGPALAGFLVQILTAPMAIAVNAFTYLASAGFLSTIRTIEPEAHERERRPWHQDLRIGFATIFSQPLLKPLFLMGATAPLFSSFFSALYMFYALKVLNLSPTMIGITVAMGGIGSLAGALMAEPFTRWLGVGRGILVTYLISALSAFFVPLAHGSPPLAMSFLIAAQLIGDSFAVAAIITSTSLRQTIVPLNLMGRVGAAFRVGTGAPVILGAVMGGLLGEWLGPRESLYISAAGVVLSMGWGFFSPLWRLSDMPVAPEGASR
jgi:Na+/melibiose symporter-like transporter